MNKSTLPIEKQWHQQMFTNVKSKKIREHSFLFQMITMCVYDDGNVFN